MIDTTCTASHLPTAVTFLGRGLAHVFGTKLSLLVCPKCSQRNPPKVVAKGYCNWCAYEPSRDDIRPVA